MVERSNSDRLRGFCDRQTDRQTFAILESLSRLKNYAGNWDLTTAMHHMDPTGGMYQKSSPWTTSAVMAMKYLFKNVPT